MQPLTALSGDATSISAIIQAVDAARSARPDVALALATLVNVEGSSYRQPGARLLVDAEQRVLAGAISGGCLEGDVALRAREVCDTSQPLLLRYDLREDLETIWGFGAACDGIAHVLVEPLHDDSWLRAAQQAMLRRTRPVLVTRFDNERANNAIDMHTLYHRSDEAPQYVDTALRTSQPFIAIDEDGAHRLCEPLDAPVALHIIGAGRSAEAFATIASALGWQVTIIDHREELLRTLQLPRSTTTQLRRSDDGLGDLPMDDRTVVAILTHIFQVDLAWLAALLAQPVAYIGVLGSRNRASRLLTQLSDDGVVVSPDMQRRLFAPIGLDLGGESPESIALAGIAEMEAVLHERPGGFLRSRQSPIHTRTPIPLVVSAAVDAVIEQCALPTDVRS